MLGEDHVLYRSDTQEATDLDPYRCCYPYMPLLWFGLNSRDVASGTHIHRTQPYLAGHSGAATPSSAYSHPGFLASDQNICGRRQRKGKKGEEKHTENNNKFNQIKRQKANFVI